MDSHPGGESEPRPQEWKPRRLTEHAGLGTNSTLNRAAQLNEEGPEIHEKKEKTYNIKNCLRKGLDL